MLVAVGSTNPVKLESTREAFTQAWPAAKTEVRPTSVASGVAAQPMSDVECIEGARNRAILARESLDGDYGVGIEAGLVHIGGLWFNGAWVVIVDADFREGLGSTVRVPVPTSVVRRVEHGQVLSEVLDDILGEDESQGIGYFGQMTGGVVTRGRATSDAVVAALARFSHPTLFA